MFERTTRRTLLATIGATVAGCTGSDGDDGTSTSTAAGPSQQTPGQGTPADGSAGTPTPDGGDDQTDLTLSSPAFEDGGPIPEQYGRNEQDVNPPLRISGVPDDAAALTLVMDDPDAVEPAGKVWLHWLVWNIPPDRTEIPERWQPDVAVEGINDFDESGYGGPAPPDEQHTYRFRLFAVEEVLDRSESASKSDVVDASRNNLLAEATLSGTYSP